MVGIGGALLNASTMVDLIILYLFAPERRFMPVFAMTPRITPIIKLYDFYAVYDSRQKYARVHYGGVIGKVKL